MTARSLLIATITAERAGVDTFLKWQVMLCIAHRPGVAMGNICAVLSRSTSGVYNCLQSLTDRGLLNTTNVHTGNRPAALYHLTDQGHAVMARFMTQQAAKKWHKPVPVL